MSAPYQRIRFGVEDGVTTLVLDNTDKRNAVDFAVCIEMAELESMQANAQTLATRTPGRRDAALFSGEKNRCSSSGHRREKAMAMNQAKITGFPRSM